MNWPSGVLTLLAFSALAGGDCAQILDLLSHVKNPWWCAMGEQLVRIDSRHNGTQPDISKLTPRVADGRALKTEINADFTIDPAAHALSH